ncbi:CocE/NonD family hydrolase [Actinokineospora iranica]|uniref:Xaa-Pro dipeptidyl-peptidase C-terminal domain-containing protein n=1 Tax=Actinokineospora iranica TaxID=1271860 RepID=A0A1G6U0I0_9PSEU|nr:CocE/NonD family hydrolase [Actinokineospora iranica]SDD34117.1 hypothetical protein SAMN05216174_11012 [Actinokineospora iranica]
MPTLILARLLTVVALAGVFLVDSGQRANAAWAPGPQRYGVGKQGEVPVTMSDGTVLRADVYYPTDETGAPAPGRFPVVLSQTPYGALAEAAPGLSDPDAGALTLIGGGDTYLVRRGYVNVVADVRGTGGSQGTWDFLGPREAEDGAALVRWAAGLPMSNGVVGLTGSSYMAINQFFTLAALGPDSPVRALFPVMPSLDPFRDMVFPGGTFGLGSNAVYLGLTALMHLVNAGTAGNPDLAQVLVDRVAGLLSFHAKVILNGATDGDLAYDGPFWQARSTRAVLPDVVRTGVPIQLVGGWDDVFARGQLHLYSDLQSLAAGGRTGEPMRPDRPADPRYRLLMGQWHHVTVGAGVDLDALRLQWFDHWLKGIDTGISGPPMRLAEIGGDRWVGATHFPFPQAHPTPLHLREAGGLTRERAPVHRADLLVHSPLGVPCNRGLDQSTAGGLIVALRALGLPEPCAGNDNLSQLPPLATTYTTAPFTEPTVLAGPIAATVHATSTRPDTQLTVTVSDIAPNGASTPLTSGSLAGTHRAVDPTRSWLAPDGNYLLPFHPYTREAATPVPVGALVRHDIEIAPTFARLEPGHRLRITVSTTDTPRLLPLPKPLLNQLGGLYGIHHGPTVPSLIEIPLAPASAFSG